MTRFLCLLACLCWGRAATFGQSAHELLRSGDHAYEKANYGLAEQHYRAAARQNPGSLNAIHNLGCAEYRQGKYPEAEESFGQAAAGAQLPAVKANVLYNLGNARLHQRKYAAAIEAYENSLRLRPGDAAAKQNLQMAKQRLQQQKKEEEAQKQPEKDQQNAEQPPADDQQPPADQSNQPPDKPEEQPAKQPPAQKPDDQAGKGEGEGESPPTQPGQLTRQEAQRLLETMISPEDRKNARKYRAAVQQKKLPQANRRDW